MAATITLERILALQAAYIRCIDNDTLESWPDFFLDRCLYIVTTAENHKNGYESGIIYADTKGMLIDRIAALRQANVYEKQGYRHILGLPNRLRSSIADRRALCWITSATTLVRVLSIPSGDSLLAMRQSV